MKKKTRRLVLHRETLRTLAADVLPQIAGRTQETDSDWTICELCPETTPSKCIVCCVPTTSSGPTVPTMTA